VILLANLKKKIIYHQNSDVGFITNKHKNYYKQTKVSRTIVDENKTNLIFIIMFFWPQINFSLSIVSFMLTFIIFFGQDDAFW
jgi:hypothetical protein